MASVQEIRSVRLHTNETDSSNYTDEAISELIDREGVANAVVTIWRERVARFSELVDVSEGNARRNMSQAFDNAQKMLKMYEDQVEAAEGSSGRARTRGIVRA